MTKVIEFVSQDLLIVIKMWRIPAELPPTNVITKLHNLTQDLVIVAMDYIDISKFATH